MKRFIKLLFILCLFGIIANAVRKSFIIPKKFVSPISQNVVNTALVSKTQIISNSKNLQKVVNNAISNATGTYGIAIKNLKNGESYYLNAHRVFEPGSLYKVWLMEVVFNQIQNGKLTEDETLSQDVQVLNREFDIDANNAELTDGTITLNVKDALEQMITISHNTAALLLTEKVQLSSIENFLVQNNLDESAIGEPPRTTAFDMALFFEKLYAGQLANADNTKEMIDLLKRQTLNNKLPKYLPQDVTVAHKTGEIDYLSHDAGIVFSEKGDYIIVVMSESDYPPGAQEWIAQISKAVYDYFTGK